jgi:hypothetical protein
MRRSILAVATVFALATPLVGHPTAASSDPAPRVSQVALDDAADDVWVWSEGTSTWELWGTKADTDVLGATVKHTKKVIRVVMTFDNLRKKRPAGYLAKIRTKKMVRSAWVNAGPNVGWNGEHVLLKGGKKVPAPGFTHEIDYQADTVVMVLPRSLFDGPAWIKARLRNDLRAGKDFTDNPHTTGPAGAFTGKIHTP